MAIVIAYNVYFGPGCDIGTDFERHNELVWQGIRVFGCCTRR